MMKTPPRPEHPNPQAMRKQWINLNGKWQFEMDHGRSGKERGLYDERPLKEEILVPFCPESRLSGIGNVDFMECVWYKRRFTVPEEWRDAGRRTLLHIGACDEHTDVWINGTWAGEHTGGYTPITLDITAQLTVGENQITICATDCMRQDSLACGKQQFWAYASAECSYTRTTGIWQTVWLENVPAAYIRAFRLTPIPETAALYIEADCIGGEGRTLTAAATLDGQPAGTARATVTGGRVRLEIRVDPLRLWSPQEPVLYDLELAFGDDRVASYFGMRSVAFVDGRFLLNGKPVFQRLILDQGFYPDGIYTAPDDAELAADIRRSQAMGFNGARLHQKVFEPRFLYHCDRLGYLVWGEFPDWGPSREGKRTLPGRPYDWAAFLPGWLETLERDYNHPAIIGWCPLNETSKDQDERLVKMLVDLTRAYDGNRMVIDTSGYVHVGTLSDVPDLHDYEQDPSTLEERYRDVAYPLFISEYGGIWWSDTDTAGWGYGERPASREAFLERFKGLTEVQLANPRAFAFCYTQLTDVEQEKNGLYTYDRQPKFDPAVIAAIVGQPAAIETE